MIPLGGRPCHGVPSEGQEMLLISIQVVVPMWMNAYVKAQGAWSTACCKPPASPATPSTDYRCVLCAKHKLWSWPTLTAEACGGGEISFFYFVSELCPKSEPQPHIRAGWDRNPAVFLARGKEPRLAGVWGRHPGERELRRGSTNCGQSPHKGQPDPEPRMRRTDAKQLNWVLKWDVNAPQNVRRSLQSEPQWVHCLLKE